MREYWTKQLSADSVDEKNLKKIKEFRHLSLYAKTKEDIELVFKLFDKLDNKTFNS